MNRKIITNALSFLERVQLSGKEVPAFLEVQRMLGGLLNEETEVGETGPVLDESTEQAPSIG